MNAIETRTIRKISKRLIPFLIVCYLFAYLDRVNVGFAALTMNKALGLSATMFGFGAGIFFITYFAFELPSNLFLDRLGARRWMARIMVSWGVLAGLMAFIPQIADATGLGAEKTFYTIRALLGLAEAGFFPGIIYYLTLWYPSAYRARITGAFMVAIPLSSAIGGPISGTILSLDGFAGFDGWQWLFVIQAAPAVLLGIVTYFYLTDRPNDALWLRADERRWLTERLEAERLLRDAQFSPSTWQAVINPRVWALALVYFGLAAGNYSISFWLPQIIRTFGLTNATTGWVTAIPYAVAAGFMVWYGRYSDFKTQTKSSRRRSHVALALLMAAAGLAVSTLSSNAALAVAAFMIAACGVYGGAAVFWALPTSVLSGTAAAAGIAVINSVGNLAGFCAPYAIGWVKDTRGSFTEALLLIAAIAIGAMAVVLSVSDDRASRKAPVPAE